MLVIIELFHFAKVMRILNDRQIRLYMAATVNT